MAQPPGVLSIKTVRWMPGGWVDLAYVSCLLWRISMWKRRKEKEREGRAEAEVGTVEWATTRWNDKGAQKEKRQ